MIGWPRRGFNLAGGFHQLNVTRTGVDYESAFERLSGLSWGDSAQLQPRPTPSNQITVPGPFTDQFRVPVFVPYARINGHKMAHCTVRAGIREIAKYLIFLG
jgi:hypothetical protein